MPSDVRATSHKEQTPAKVIARAIIEKSSNGGHIITHEHTQKVHAPEKHTFGPGESMNAHRHLETHMAMPLDTESAAAGTEENVGAKEASQL